MALTEISVQFMSGISCEAHWVGFATLCLQLSGEIPLLRVSVQRAVASAGSVSWYRGTSLIRNAPLPEDHHRALGMALL